MAFEPIRDYGTDEPHPGAAAPRDWALRPSPLSAQDSDRFPVLRVRLSAGGGAHASRSMVACNRRIFQAVRRRLLRCQWGRQHGVDARIHKVPLASRRRRSKSQLPTDASNNCVPRLCMLPRDGFGDAALRHSPSAASGLAPGASRALG
eukprot:3093289-Prymnesium_polylepis.1